jgi:hypothetical protein
LRDGRRGPQRALAVHQAAADGRHAAAHVRVAQEENRLLCDRGRRRRAARRAGRAHCRKGGHRRRLRAHHRDAHGGGPGGRSLIERHAAADDGDVRAGELGGQTAPRRYPRRRRRRRLRRRRGDKASGDTDPGGGLRRGDGIGNRPSERDAWAAAEGDEDALRAGAARPPGDRGIEDRELGAGQQAARRHPSPRPCEGRALQHDAAVDGEVRVVAAEPEVVHAHHGAANPARRLDPALRVSGDRIVDDEDVGAQAAEDLRRGAGDDVTAKQQRRVDGTLRAAHGDQRPGAERAGKRSAAHQVPEAAPRPGRRPEQDAQVSAGSHAGPR